MTQNLLGQTRHVYPATPGGVPSAAEKVIFDNLNLATDPTTTTDSTQGFQVGSHVLVPSAGKLRWYMCIDNTAGAAKWAYIGADYTDGGLAPATFQTQFGGAPAVSAENILPAGNIYRQVNSASVSPTFLNSDVVLAVFSLPAQTFDGAAGTNRMIQVQGMGGFAGNGNTKRVKLFYNPSAAVVGTTVSGGTLMADTLATASNGGGWYVSGWVAKYGVNSSNTQLVTSGAALAGATGNAVAAPSYTSATESSAILVAVTGNCATATTDVFCNMFIVSGFN